MLIFGPGELLMYSKNCFLFLPDMKSQLSSPVVSIDPSESADLEQSMHAVASIPFESTAVEASLNGTPSKICTSSAAGGLMFSLFFWHSFSAPQCSYQSFLQGYLLYCSPTLLVLFVCSLGHFEWQKVAPSCSRSSQVQLWFLGLSAAPLHLHY